ncbi:HDOD domain-containing protein [Marinagarivorans cellulosilyticus]|uniref:HDOD domain-containing protein n=1 Tax=Marinagarivorans cellulosilyticus TaxID=2721545 RepID=A0AAN1WJ57_9GAMM|nr:HDOD domain-containing protein [Marinagarivorans cellulosilyticus]BCD98576.1 hypothetical protein MARGE09_P2777 [Marinagarivorans cellulosilyticus]
MSVGSLLRKLLHKNADNVNAAATKYEVIEAGEYTLARCKHMYYQYLFEGSNDSELNIPQKLVIEVVINSLRKKEQRAHAIPRLPSVIPKLLRSLRDPTSSAKDYVAIIIKDPVMSAAVLKLANSVYFNPVGAHIDEIDRAVVKLGIQGLRSVLSAAVMQPIIQRESPYFSQTGQRLWVHSLNCAVACEVIGQSRQLDRYKVYLLGLVHDIGKITLFSELCKQFKLNETADAPGHSAFAPTMKKISAHLSYIIACDWDLPEDICVALKQQIGLHQHTELTAYGHLLYQANLACEMYAVTPKSHRSKLAPILTEFKLPKDLWNTLDAVDTQI